jgi:hypothetical protein
MDELFTTLPIYPPESHVKGILVNEQGQRFINEDAYPGRISSYCLRQVGSRIFLLVDHAIFEQPSPLSRIGVAAVGESWGEIERELDMAEGSLVHTVELYSRFAARGEDPLFHKSAKWLKPLDEAPFAALACHLGEAFYPFFTLGGLRTLPTGEVLTPSGEPIPGLYAAGNVMAGVMGAGYPGAGATIGAAMTFGYLAGKHAAGRT